MKLGRVGSIMCNPLLQFSFRSIKFLSLSKKKKNYTALKITSMDSEKHKKTDRSKGVVGSHNYFY